MFWIAPDKLPLHYNQAAVWHEQPRPRQQDPRLAERDLTVVIPDQAPTLRNEPREDAFEHNNLELVLAARSSKSADFYAGVRHGSPVRRRWFSQEVDLNRNARTRRANTAS